VVQGAGAERVPVGALSYAEHSPRLKQRSFRVTVAKTLGVSPRHRSHGVMDAIIVDMTERGDALYDQWLGALIREGNFSARYAGRTEVPQRRYALYRMPLEPSGGES
jgi:hypothetical protein